MSLAFLLPAGFAALAALLLPLLLHLARRHEQKPTDFAALRWLRQKPKPRHRIRFDEWPLLLLRLLLLALLALWLARPVLSGAEAGNPWVVVVPGADAAQARARSAGQDARLHWLAPGFPALDELPAEGSVPVASLLRQLDAELPAGVALTVVVPATLQGADAQRPVLARAVQWKIVDGAMPATAAVATPVPALVVRHAEGDTAGLRYLRAAAQAWRTHAGANADPISIGVGTQAVPASARHLVWLAPGAVPPAVHDWVREGGTVLLGNRSELTGFVAASVPWRDDRGDALVEASPFGKGRAMRFTRPLQPASMPELLDADFPRHLRALFATPAPPPARVFAADYAPGTGGAAYPTAPTDLQPWLAMLIALLVLVERWMATRRSRGVSP